MASLGVLGRESEQASQAASDHQQEDGLRGSTVRGERLRKYTTMITTYFNHPHTYSYYVLLGILSSLSFLSLKFEYTYGQMKAFTAKSPFGKRHIRSG